MPLVLNLRLNLRVSKLCMRAATIQVVTSVTVWVCPFTFQAVAQADAQSPEITFRTSSNLVLVDVVALNSKNELADTTLRRDDFQLLDNGRPVAIKTFDSATGTRPLALWFVVQCKMAGWESRGSGLFRGQIHRFEPVLKTRNPRDSVAVAHWCDNGDSRLDLLPTSNAEEATATLEQVLTPVLSANLQDRAGELALQQTLQLIIDETRSLSPEPVPVLIFLYGDYSGMPKAEADHFIDELLATSAIAYGLKDSRSPGIWLIGEQAEVGHHIASETGGVYLKVAPENYATGLTQILRQLDSRYELGFQPEALDGKRHKLTVKLTDAAKKEHTGVRLRYRLAYVPVER